VSYQSENKKYPYGYGLGKISLAKLYMNKANLSNWSFRLSILGMLFLFSGTLIKKYFPTLYQFIWMFTIALGFVIWGFLGLFWAYRRETDRVEGITAFIMGMVMMLGSWTMTLFLFVKGIQSILEILNIK
jgi:hypothetical protein